MQTEKTTGGDEHNESAIEERVQHTISTTQEIKPKKDYKSHKFLNTQNRTLLNLN